MKRYRYVIRGRPYGSANARDICWVDTNPEAIAAALEQKQAFLGTGPDGRDINIGQYDRIEIVDNLAAQPSPSFAQPREENAGNAGTTER